MAATKRFNLSEIMVEAWDYAKYFAEEKGGKASEYMSFSLKVAWAEAKEKDRRYNNPAPWGRELAAMYRNLKGKGSRKTFTKVPTVRRAIYYLKDTKQIKSRQAFIDGKVPYELVAKTIYEITNGLIEIVDTRSEGQKAVDWFAKKRGLDRNEKRNFLPSAEEVEEFAENNGCTVFQAVARMAKLVWHTDLIASM